MRYMERYRDTGMYVLQISEQVNTGNPKTRTGMVKTEAVDNSRIIA